jgi:hypothetical protein
MTIDRRFIVALVIALLVVAVAVAVVRGPLGYGRDDGGPGGACPPGHVTSSGCRAP